MKKLINRQIKGALLLIAGLYGQFYLWVEWAIPLMKEFREWWMFPTVLLLILTIPFTIAIPIAIMSGKSTAEILIEVYGK